MADGIFHFFGASDSSIGRQNRQKTKSTKQDKLCKKRLEAKTLECTT